MNGAFQQAIARLQEQVLKESLHENDPRIVKLGEVGIRIRELDGDFVESSLIGSPGAKNDK